MTSAAQSWRIFEKGVTASTNLDARAGNPFDVFTANHQTAGRGRLDHRWLSPPGANLMMSVVLPVAGLSPERVSTLPLLIGLSVAEAAGSVLPAACTTRIKWPNDVLVDGRKLCGILCELNDDCAIAGIGVNVAQREFAPEIAGRATSLALCLGGEQAPSVAEVRDRVLGRIAGNFERWRIGGLAPLHAKLSAYDTLCGRAVSVRQTDDDAEPISGICGGIMSDGTLLVGGRRIYAGEAHVL